jgi:hypothetical protein
VYARKYAKYIGKDKVEQDDVIDSFGLRLNFKILALKFGWSTHAFDGQTNKP